MVTATITIAKGTNTAYYGLILPTFARNKEMKKKGYCGGSSVHSDRGLALEYYY